MAALGAALTVSAITASTALAVDVPDASCNANLGAAIVMPNGDQKVAQTFPALHTGPLTSATSALTNRLGSTPGDWRFEIAATSGGLPGSVLASAIVPNTLASGAQGFVTARFAAPAQVTAGTLYAVLFSRPGSSSYAVAEQGGDPCPGQGYFQMSVGGPFSIDANVDFNFATTVDQPTGQQAAALKKCKKKHSKKKRKKCRKRARKLPL
jgi:hypothetical protein